MEVKEINEKILKHLKETDYSIISKDISTNISGRIPHHMMQVLYSICSLYDIKTYMEIGVHNGASMSYVIQEPIPKKCFGVDLFENGKLYAFDKLTKQRTEQNIQKNNKSNSNVTLIQGDSTHDSTINSVGNLIKEPIDLLFLDGDHSYAGVKHDFENYSKYVKSGGFILLDDYHKSKWPGIKQFVDNDIDTTKFTRVGWYNENELLFIKK